MYLCAFTCVLGRAGCSGHTSCPASANVITRALPVAFHT